MRGLLFLTAAATAATTASTTPPLTITAADLRGNATAAVTELLSFYNHTSGVSGLMGGLRGGQVHSLPLVGHSVTFADERA